MADVAPGFAPAGVASGQLLEHLGRDRDAETAYIATISRVDDHPDARTCLAGLWTRQGRVADAVAALREASGGGPKGTRRAPREDPSLALTLAYLLTLRGHAAEPATLCAAAESKGGGLPAMLLAARAFSDVGDEDAVRARRVAGRASPAKRPRRDETMFRSRQRTLRRAAVGPHRATRKG